MSHLFQTSFATSQVSDADIRTQNTAQFLAELSLMEYRMLQHPPSLIGASCAQGGFLPLPNLNLCVSGGSLCRISKGRLFILVPFFVNCCLSFVFFSFDLIHLFPSRSIVRFWCDHSWDLNTAKNGCNHFYKFQFVYQRNGSATIASSHYYSDHYCIVISSL